MADVVDASFTCGVIGRVVVVNWHTDLTRPAMRRAFGCILAARHEAGAPLVNVSVIPPQASGPAPEYTANTEWHMRVIDHVCEAIYVVNAGHSVTQILWRGVMSVAALALRMDIGSCSTVEEAFNLAGRRVGEEPSVMLLEARARGLIR